MEELTIKAIEQFVRIAEHPNGSGDGSGDGSGSGSGSGSGDGSGDGSGSGDGYGSGYGYGSSDGSGSGYGSGYGFGSGSGDGSGDGSGSGYGYGSSDGSGSGYGSGYGFGYSNNIESFRGEKVYMIDKTPTIIHSVHLNYARASILNSDLTLTPCFVAKRGNYFAHGKTIKAAFQSVMEKYNENRPLAERIAEFNSHYLDRDEKVPAKELFSWHHILTGSCLFGRQQWCKEHGIDYEKGMYSVNEFIQLTLTAYGGENIKQLRDTLPSK